MFPEVEKNPSFPKMEEKILSFWKEARIFQRSVEKDAPKGNYIFFEGPPTANGRPGIHHVSARGVKDLFPRYKTMQGYRCERRGGWDTHGLPVEVEVEKEIGSTGKHDIEKFGVAAFNAKCKDSVFRYMQDWVKLTERIAFWVDLDKAYITYDNGYIESVWWVLKSFFDRGLLFEDYKVTMHCPRCNTSLADHEVSLGMKEDVDDPSVWPKFPAPLDEFKKRGFLPASESRPLFILAWTTTPWTLGANSALAVAADEDYVILAGPPFHGAGEGEGKQLYVVAKALAPQNFEEGTYEILSEMKGSALVGITYSPVLKGRAPEGENLSGGWRVITDASVSISDGTGIIHIAPAYGDLEIGKANGLPTLFSVDLAAKMFPEVDLLSSTAATGPYDGMWFKDADKELTRDLKKAGLMFRSGRVKHAYPFCWRDGQPLLFYAKTAWYIRTTAVKDRLLANNNQINWVPDAIRTGRFGRWLENNVDWALSRERYWGTPLPIWVSEDGSESHCVGSVQELSDLTGRDLTGLDLHRPYVDEITFTKNGKTFRRVNSTIDVWFDSGAMPLAQWHYPFENKEAFERSFPADFICEAIDQTRGWFYSLHAIGTLLTDPGDPASGRPPGALAHLGQSSSFRNVVVLGHINDDKGQKMSKSKGNVVDPWSVLNAQGSDALRWYLYASSPPEKNKSFDKKALVETFRDVFLTLWSTYDFFVLYANIDQPDLAAAPGVQARPEIDRWLISLRESLIQKVTAALDAYDPTTAARAIGGFISGDLSNWYVRRNRRRFWRGAKDADKLAAYATLYETLVTIAKLMAPMAPFMADEIYRALVLSVDKTAPESVHLAQWPVAQEAWIDQTLMSEMGTLIRAVELARAARQDGGFKVRQPLPELQVGAPSAAARAALSRFADQIAEELNVKQVTILPADAAGVNYALLPNLPVIGKRMGKRIPALRAALAAADARAIAANVRAGVNTELVLDGETVSLEPEAFLVEVKAPEGFLATEGDGLLVLLKTDLTPELVAEGIARDVVRLVQQARKNAGLAVTDRIKLGLEADPAVAQAVEANRAMIESECLVDRLALEALADCLHREVEDIDGAALTLTLAKA